MRLPLIAPLPLVLTLLAPVVARAQPTPGATTPASPRVELEASVGGEALSVRSDYPSTTATAGTVGVAASYVGASGLAAVLGAAIGAGDAQCDLDAPCVPAMWERSARLTAGVRYFARAGTYLHASALYARTWARDGVEQRLVGLGATGGIGWRKGLTSGGFVGVEVDAVGWRASLASAGDPVALGARLALTLGLSP